MGIERYLCVGGIEIANPCRTLAYLRNMGTPCLVRPPSRSDCGCCPEWEPSNCDGSVLWGFEIQEGGESVCLPILGIDVPDSLVFAYFEVAMIPCGDGERPPVPPPDDPAWQFSGAISLPPTQIVAMFSEGGCPTWAALTSGYPEGFCAYARYRLVGADSGMTFEGLFYLDAAAAAEGGLGLSGVSIDGGASWSQQIEQVESGPCEGSPILTISSIQLPGETQICQGLVAVTGLGPFEIKIEIQPAPPDFAPPDPIPEEGWILAVDGTLDVVPGLGGCFDYGSPDAENAALSRITIRDLGTGASISAVTWSNNPGMAPGDLGGSAYTLDGGASWTLLPIGLSSWSAEGTAPAGEFRTPVLDDAPWYDPAVPESADLLGVFIEEARLSNPWTREVRAKMKGASLGPGRLQGRELTITGWLYARTEAATAYGRQWLFEALAGSGCEGDCDLPDAVIYTHCERQGGSSGARTLKRVGLTSFDPEIEAEFPRACGLKFEAVLTAEIPELFLDPALEATLVPADLEAVICNVCSACPEPDPTACSCGALSQPTRIVPVPDPASGFCEPVGILRATQPVSPPAYWREATSILEIDGGEDGLANLRVRAWANPAGLPAPTLGDDLFACQEPCLDLEIACVPPRTRLLIDGTTRRATLLCEGVERDGYAYLSSSGGQRLRWPDVGCHGLMLVADFDADNTGPDAEISFVVVPRERG